MLSTIYFIINLLKTKSQLTFKDNNFRIYLLKSLATIKLFLYNKDFL